MAWKPNTSAASGLTMYSYGFGSLCRFQDEPDSPRPPQTLTQYSKITRDWRHIPLDLSSISTIERAGKEKTFKIYEEGKSL
jgi:hypothetical protein